MFSYARKQELDRANELKRKTNYFFNNRMIRPSFL